MEAQARTAREPHALREEEPSAGADQLVRLPAGEADEPPRPQWGARILAALLALLALAWLAAALWPLAREGAYPDTVGGIAAAISFVSGPLILLAILWLIFGRSSRRETMRFRSAVRQLREENETLYRSLAAVGEKLAANRALLEEHGERLIALGEEAAGRLGQASEAIAETGAGLEQRTAALERAAASARDDMGALLDDLPAAEQRVGSLAERLRQTGLAAHEQAGALEAELSALLARGREADGIAGGAAQRLAANLAQIEGSLVRADERMEAAGTRLGEMVETAMEQASEAAEATRTLIDEQMSALLATIEQSRTALTGAGDEASRALGERLDAVARQVQSVAGDLAAQDAATESWLQRLANELRMLGERIADLGEKGATSAAELQERVEASRSGIAELSRELADSRARAQNYIGEAEEIGAALEAVTSRLNEEVSAALANVRRQADEARSSAETAVPFVEALDAASDHSAARLAELEEGLARKHKLLEALLDRIEKGVGEADAELVRLAESLDANETRAATLADVSAPRIREALAGIREAAEQAAQEARKAVLEAIPDSAAALAKAGEEAFARTVDAQVARQIADIEAAAERLTEIGQQAAERLAKHMLSMNETGAALEEHIEKARAEREAREGDAMSRRVALLIESLNSTAIDVAKILSNEVTDSAWAAYLKGDRGVFTRRAVRLLDSGEAREIAQHYEEDREFRDNVNRYIHDFEAMLRRILAERDGSPLAVTMLSSDMGKLYVALAQAIERLRS